MTWTMPAEWQPHKRTWMAWPANPDLMDVSEGPEGGYQAWANVANAVQRFEPVHMLCRTEDMAEARARLDPGVTLIEAELGDAWMRDSGPSFVVSEDGRLGAVDWTFNGWGGRILPEGVADTQVARRVAEAAGAERIASKLVNEGGGIHVDGEGTLLLTESVQLNPNRNPNWTRAEVEAELHARLGTSKAIWLPRGVVADTGPFGTDGHVDTLACFIRPGVVVVHGQPDPQHPDHETAREIEGILRAETDAQGRPLEVIVLDAPEEIFIEGEPLSASYVNFSFVNGGAVLCGFDDPQDAETVALFERLLPDRRVVMVPATEIFARGGGVHCITQQEPLCAANGG